MLCQALDGFETEAKCLAAFARFRWADQPEPYRYPYPRVERRDKWSDRKHASMKRRAYACPRPSCRCKEFNPTSSAEGTWDYYKRKCRKCGAETSLTKGTAFEGLKFRRDSRMMIISSAALARARGANTPMELLRAIGDDAEIDRKTAARLLKILRLIGRKQSRTWHYQFNRLVYGGQHDTSLPRR